VLVHNAGHMVYGALQIEAVELCKPIIHVRRTSDIDAELTCPLAGRDLGVRSAVDIGAHAQNRRCLHPAVLRELREDLALLFKLQIKLADAGLQRVDQLPTGLFDARKDDGIGRGTCTQGPT
jgi:hypothetical protein